MCVHVCVFVREREREAETESGRDEAGQEAISSGTSETPKWEVKIQIPDPALALTGCGILGQILPHVTLSVFS